jgi:hypothetical protein
MRNCNVLKLIKIRATAWLPPFGVLSHKASSAATWRAGSTASEERLAHNTFLKQVLIELSCPPCKNVISAYFLSLLQPL